MNVASLNNGFSFFGALLGLNSRLEELESAESSEVQTNELRDDAWVTTALLDVIRDQIYHLE